jgi:hypothetical protein
MVEGVVVERCRRLRMVIGWLLRVCCGCRGFPDVLQVCSAQQPASLRLPHALRLVVFGSSGQHV